MGHSAILATLSLILVGLALQFKVILSLHGSRYATPFATDHNPVRATFRVPGR